MTDDSKTSSLTPPQTTDQTSHTNSMTSTTTMTETENARSHARTRTDLAGVRSAAFWADHVPALISEKLTFQVLFDFYHQNSKQTTRLRGLPKYSGLRRVRGDMQCCTQHLLLSTPDMSLSECGACYSKLR